MSIGEELATYLAAQSVGVSGETLFVGRLPDAPVQATAIIEYPGAPGEYIQEQPRVAIEKPHVQIQCRAATYPLGRTLINTAYQAIDAIRNQTLSGTRYLGGFPIQPPFVLERDANELVVFAFNAELWRAAA